MRELINLIESALNEAVSTDSPQFKAWFGSSKVVDEHGNPIPVYHGTGRPDRVGSQFRKSRATAGPMAYFTDSPELASNYAQSKADTSFEGEDDYNGWFKVKIPGQRSLINIDRAWYYLNQSQKLKILELAPKITSDDESNIVFDENATSGNGGFSDYRLREHKGNALATLVDAWLSGGALIGEEIEFLKILKMVQFPFPVEMHNPNATFPAVYQVFLSIQNPLVTNKIPDNVVTVLTNVAKRLKQKTSPDWAPLWDKRYHNPREWIQGLIRDLENQTTFTWTVVPDWVTVALKKLGYDGIQDVSGKYGGDKHTVWIPFEENQVKSAISNKNFDPNKKNIHK